MALRSRRGPAVSSAPMRPLLALLSLLSLLVGSSTLLSVSGQAPFELNIVYSIDIRGRMLPIDSYQADCKPADVAADVDAATTKKACYGGIARRYGFVQKQRELYPNTLVMDAGNIYYGSSFMKIVNPAGSNIAKWVSSGSTPATNYYDVIGLGSNDFFNGPATLGGYLNALTPNHPAVVSTNMLWKAEKELYDQPNVDIKTYSMHVVDGRKVAVMSVITAQLLSSALAGDVDVWPSTIQAVNETVTDIKEAHPDCNIFVLMSNLRTHAENEAISAAVPEIDVVIYRSMTDDETVVYDTVNSAGTMVVWATMPNTGGASAFGGSMGSLRVVFDSNGRGQSLEGGVVEMDRAIPHDGAMWTEVQAAYEEVAALDNQIVANIDRDYGEYQPRPVPDSTPDYDNYCRLFDCNLGRLMTDSMMHWCSDCDFAHVNAGGLRTNLYRGPLGSNVTRGALSGLMPFGNNYVWYKIQGRDFQESFLKIAATKATAGGFPQFSNLRWAWNPRYETNETVAVSPRGITSHIAVRDPISGEWVAFNPQKVYKIATLNFMFTRGAGDGYKIGPTRAYEAFGPPDVDAVIDWMSSSSFKAPPTLSEMRACSNTTYVLEDPGDGNLVWPASQCNTIRSLGTRDLSETCDTNLAMCSVKEVYEGKFVDTANCGTCSGLGTCRQQMCACDRPLTTGLFADIVMIQGEVCSAIRSEYSYNPGLVGFLYGFSALTMVVTLGVSAFFYVHRDAKVVKRSANMFLQIACVGAVLAVIACFSILTPTNDISCEVSNWFGNMGFVLLFGSLFVKTWRIYAIFGNKRLKTVVLTDRDMLLRLAVFVAFELILRFTELGVTPIRMTARALEKGGRTPQLIDFFDKLVPDPDDYYYLTCSSPDYTIIDTINWVYKACFTLWGCGLAYSIKDIQEDFNESKLLALVIYNMTVFAVIAKIIILFVGGGNPSATLVIEVLAINIVVLATLLGLSVPKWLVIRKGPVNTTTQSQLSRTGATGNKHEGGGGGMRGGGTTDDDQTVNVTMGAGGVGAAAPGGRVNPAMFAKTCETIRNRLRISAQERHHELVPFLEHATRFVEQLQTLRGGAAAAPGSLPNPYTPSAGRPIGMSIQRTMPSRGGGGGGGENRIDGANSSASHLSGMRNATPSNAPMSPSSISVELGPLALRSSSASPLNNLPPLPMRTGQSNGHYTGVMVPEAHRQPMVGSASRDRSSSRSDSPPGPPSGSPPIYPHSHVYAHALSPNLVPDEQPEPPPEDEYEPSANENE